MILLATLALLGAALAFAAWQHTFRPRLREVVVPVAGLEREISLLQVSDAHGNRFGERQAGIERVLAGRRYDAIVLTGDTLDRPRQSRGALHELVAVLGRHSERVCYLRGNHDPLDLGADLGERGVRPLEPGELLPLAAGTSVSEAALLYATHADSIACAGGSGRRMLVIVSHTPPDPGRLAAAAALGEGKRLFVAGHTHGGQIRLPLIGAIWAPMSWYAEEGGRPSDNEITLLPDLRGRLVAGMYEREGQDVFVSCGLGTTGFDVRGRTYRFRLGAPAEMVEFRFVPAE